MRRSFLVLGLCVLSVFLVIQPSLYAANLLYNPGFENGLNDWLTKNGSPATLSTAKVHSGTYSARKIIARVTPIDYWSQTYQDVALSAGQPVYARIYASSNFSPLATATAGLMLQFMDANNNVKGATLNSAKIGGTTAWRMLEVSSKAAPAGTVKVRLSAFVWAAYNDTKSLTGSAFFDDAYLDKVYRLPQAQTVLLNRAFENGLNDWTDIYGNPATIATTVFQQGLYSARKKVTTIAERDYWSQLQQIITCTAGKKVTATLYAKTVMNVASSGKAGLQVELLSATDKVLATYVGQIGGQTDWRKITITIPSTLSGTAKIKFSCFIYATQGDTKAVGGLAYFDNGTLTITTP